MDPTDPIAVWAALTDTIGQRGFAWLRRLEIASLDADRVTLRPLPGQREILAFCTDQRLAQIAEHLAPILGRRVRVSVERTPRASEGDEAPAAPDAATPATRAAERRDAMNLPLVQRVLEAFPDATLLDARDETPTEPPPD